MNKKRYSILTRITCFMVVLCILFGTSATLAFAKEDKSEQLAPSIETKAYGRIDTVQRFILDAMGNSQRHEIASTINSLNKYNIPLAVEKLSKILKGSWKSRKGQTEILTVLTEILQYSPKAKLSLVFAIHEGFDRINVPTFLSKRIKEKINKDMTGNSKDNRGVMFMVRALQVTQNLAPIGKEQLITVDVKQASQWKLYFNRLEKYPTVTASVSEVLSSLHSLPFTSRSYGAFVGYYENYFNKLGSLDVISFLYLLRENDIQYTTVGI